MACPTLHSMQLRAELVAMIRRDLTGLPGGLEDEVEGHNVHERSFLGLLTRCSRLDTPRLFP